MPTAKPSEKAKSKGRTSRTVAVAPARERATVLFLADIDQELFFDTKSMGIVKAGEGRTFPVSRGGHAIEARSVDGTYRWSKDILIDDMMQFLVRSGLGEVKRLDEDRAAAGGGNSDASRGVARPAATPKLVKQLLPKGAVIDLVLVGPGLFEMGSSTGDDDERGHTVSISAAFYVGQFEVTQRQWMQVMGSNPSEFTGDDRRPVENVTWNEIQEFLRRLNAVTDGGFRLPTEAEWEYACRAGTSGDHAGVLDELAWYEANSGAETHPVGMKQPNAWGLYDMHGNVWEWCQDWYGEYPSGVSTDPQGPPTGAKRVSRGGSWSAFAPNCRSAFRDGDGPDARYGDLGFRIVRTVR